jgi:hypothetical protein
LNEACKDLLAGHEAGLFLLEEATEQSSHSELSSMSGKPAHEEGRALPRAVLRLPLTNLQLGRWFDYVCTDPNTKAPVAEESRLNKTSLDSIVNGILYLHELHGVKGKDSSKVLLAQMKKGARRTEARQAKVGTLTSFAEPPLSMSSFQMLTLAMMKMAPKTSRGRGPGTWKKQAMAWGFAVITFMRMTRRSTSGDVRLENLV